VRFAASHKAATYAAVACAFLAAALSGELSPIVVGLAMLGGIASWWFEPPRVDLVRLQPWLTGFTALWFAWSVVQLLIGGDVLVLGAEFLLVLTVAKLMGRIALKDALQANVLGFLMLTAGTALNGELTFGLCFLAYVVASTWSLMLYHLRRELEDHHVVPGDAAPLARVLASRRVVDRRFFLGGALVSLAVFAGAAVMFVLIPRMGLGIFMSKSRGGVSMAGFSDNLQLDGHGTIRSDDTVVMRVEVKGAPVGRDAPAMHWRGVAFDSYAQGGWRRTKGRAPSTRTRITTGPRDLETYHLLYDGPQPGDALLAARNLVAVRQAIYLEPLGSSVLFGAGQPLAFEITPPGDRWRKTARDEARRRDQFNDEIRYPHELGMRYVVYSDLSPPPAAELRRAGDALPAGFELYLALPDEITARTRALAAEITAGATNDYDKITRLEGWLKQNLRYTLEQESPGDQEPLDVFLFERKMGHCEYFSSALAVLGRAVGVPTRNVNGFLGGEWNEYDEYVAVRAGDAHSWVEAFFPGHGWVTFDATPSAEASGLGRGGDGLLERARRMADTLRFKWFKWVIEYDLSRQLGVFKSIGALLKGGASGVLKAKGQAIKAWLKAHRTTAGGVVVGIAALVVAVGLRRRRGREEATLLGERPRGPRPEATRAYARALRRLARRGHKKHPTTTPREHAGDLARAGIPGAAALAELAELHYAAEYDGADPARHAARARALERTIEADRRAARRRRPT
jgi:transglutaminase-like putative cysteine protease